MSIRKNLQFNRVDFTYDSKDGESYSITYIDTMDREYFEVSGLGNAPEDKQIYDVAMWEEILAERNKIKNPPVSIKIDRSNLQCPRISDLRSTGITLGPEAIQDNVDQSMDRVDDNIPPVESFSPISETPADWKISEYSSDNLSSWKDEVKYRQENVVRPPVLKHKGNEGTGFRRVDAEDLI